MDLSRVAPSYGLDFPAPRAITDWALGVVLDDLRDQATFSRDLVPQHAESIVSGILGH